MQPPSQLNRIFRFGEFEFSVRAGELRKNGEVVRLQYQPLRVLLALLEYAGEVITREEIRERVWSDDSVQDFDNSLRVAINKLRQALGDDTDSPQYIETLPRRGYRWRYPVTVQELQPSSGDVGVQLGNGNGTAEPPSTAILAKVLGPRRTDRSMLRRSAAVTLALCLLALAAFLFLRPGQIVTEPRVLPLTTYPGLEYMPSLSPDGKRVAFAWTGPNPTDPYGVYIKQIGDDRAQRLTDAPLGATDGDPVWSPDGKSVFFYRRGGPSAGIYVAPERGGPARQIAATSLSGVPLKRARFDISPTGTTLVYPDLVADQHTIALFLLDLATLQSHQLTYPPHDSDGDVDPAFSHDGKSIVFERNTFDLQQVYVVPAGGGDVRLIKHDNRADIDGLVWTLDDREVLLGGQQLRRIPASGAEHAPSAISYIAGPAFYPTLRGNLLAYSQAWVNANVWKLELRDSVHPAGNPVRLIASTREQAAASFSPDSTQIAFQSNRSGAWEIWKSNRDGSNAVQLTHFRGPLTGTPRWSPDGKQIVFDSRPTGVSEIFVVPSTGGEPRQLTNDPAGSMVPWWSRDGKWIYYSSNHGGATNVWKMPAAGGAAHQVTTNGGIYAAESPDGEFVYYSRSHLDATLWRIALNGGTEELVAGAPKPFDCSHWALASSGIYIVDANGDLFFYPFAGRRPTKVLHYSGFLTDWSMAVSPDGREVVWAQIDNRFADLMLVENFR